MPRRTLLLFLFSLNWKLALAFLGTQLCHRNAISIACCGYSKIRQGEIYVQEHFLSPQEVTLLQQDIAQLQRRSTKSAKGSTNGFRPSGLSNRVKGDKNEFGSSDRLTCTITPDLYVGNTTLSDARSMVEGKLEDLGRKLQEELMDGQQLKLELAELYYSVSPKGSHLPRHQDERHEETKGSKGWINDTRRSISWLIYLNEDGWGASKASPGHGGELRAYVRKSSGAPCGSHDGNIQVGWLRNKEASSSSSKDEYEPVFLDSWVKMRADIPTGDDNIDEDCPEWQALSALYRIRTDENRPKKQELLQHETEQPMRDYLSPPFGPNSPSWPSDSNLEPTDFASALGLQLLDPDHQKRFVGVEDVTSTCEIVDIVPTGGTLVLFDSVAVPHEVLEVTDGTRLAIAGWFHEAQQEFPQWYGT